MMARALWRVIGARWRQTVNWLYRDGYGSNSELYRSFTSREECRQSVFQQVNEPEALNSAERPAVDACTGESDTSHEGDSVSEHQSAKEKEREDRCPT